MLKAYGIDYNILDSLSNMPSEIKQMMDILSMTRKHLSKTNGLGSAALISDIQACTQLDTLSSITERAKSHYRDFAHSLEVISHDVKRVTATDVINDVDKIYSTYELKQDYGYSPIDSKLMTVDKELAKLSADKYIELSQNKNQANVSVNVINNDDLSCFEWCRAYETSCNVKTVLSSYETRDKYLSYVQTSISSNISSSYVILKFKFANDIRLDDDWNYGLFRKELTQIDSSTSAWQKYTDGRHDMILSKNDKIDFKSDYKLIALMPFFEQIVNNFSDVRSRLTQIFNFPTHDGILSYYEYLYKPYGNIQSDVYEKVKKLADIISKLIDKEFNDINKNESIEVAYKQLINSQYDSLYTDDNLFKQWLSNAYYTVLNGFTNLRELDSVKDENGIVVGTKIYTELSTELLGNATLENTLSSSSRIAKLEGNVSLDFDEVAAVDKIENYEAQLSDWSGVELQLISAEMTSRHQPMKSDLSNLMTRTSYYRKLKVKEYFKLIEDQVHGDNETNFQEYKLDSRYVKVDKNTKMRILSINNNKLCFNDDMVKYTAKLLADMTIYISELRNSLKIKAQQYYMKGTFNLFSFVVNEYLQEFSKMNYLQHKKDVLSADADSVKTINDIIDALNSHTFNDIDIVQYNDTTEYFNLSSESTPIAKNGQYANYRYWEDLGTDDKFSIGQDRISNFYMNVLNLKDKIDSESSLDVFLNSIYGIGALSSCVNQENGKIKLCSDPNLSSEFATMYLNWSGTHISETPWYNHKNITHPSFQVHPYLYKFVEDIDIATTIQTNFNSPLVESLTDEAAIAKIKTGRGIFGESINLWKTNYIDFSGYQTKYESSLHKTNLNQTDALSVIDYEGLFYENAVKEFLDNPELAIDSIYKAGNSSLDETNEKTFYDKYYEYLNLSKADRLRIANQLSVYHDVIKIIAEQWEIDEDIPLNIDYSYVSNKLSVEITNEDTITSIENTAIHAGVFDIYKYATDKFGNHLILLKQYANKNVSQVDKDNTPGQLWIRLKDHPIAFPAFWGLDPAVELDCNNANNVICNAAPALPDCTITPCVVDKDGNVASEQVVSMKLDTTMMSYFYDMELDITKRVLVLNSYPIHDKSLESYYGFAAYDNYIKNVDKFNSREHSIAILCDVVTYKDINNNSVPTQLRFLQDVDANEDQIFNNKLLPIDGKIYSFVGYSKNKSVINLTYVEKDIDDDGNKSIPINPTIIQTQHIWHQPTKNSILKQQLNVVEHIPALSNFEVATDEIRFSQDNELMTIAYLVKSNEQINATNFIGSNKDLTQLEYPNDANPDSNGKSSLDAFDAYIAIVDFNQTENGFNIKEATLNNLNVDSSYIPLYAGTNGLTDLSYSKRYNDVEVKQIELLGKQQGLREFIGAMDYSGDVEYDIATLENNIPGRIYEDLNTIDMDIVRTYSNPTMSHNGIYDNDEYFEFTVDLTNYDVDKLNALQLVCYCANTTRKNPYYSGKIFGKSGIPVLSNIPQSALQYLKDHNYNVDEDIVLCAYDKLDEWKKCNYISSDVDADIPLSGRYSYVKIAGTYNYFDNAYNAYDTNHIKNIKSIHLAIEFNMSKDKQGNDTLIKLLHVKLHKSDANVHTYIQQNNIAFVVVNTKQMKLYNYYHYMDEAGKIKTDKNGKSYFLVGPEKHYLTDIDFEDYNSLEDAIKDIPILQGVNGVSFKYNEEDVYDIDDNRFYYPGCNEIYPKIDINSLGMDLKSIDISNLFSQKSLYMLKLDNSIDKKILSVEIDIQQNETECLMLTEDYLDTDLEYGNPDLIKYICFADSEESNSLPFKVIYEHDYDGSILKYYDAKALNNFINFEAMLAYLWNYKLYPTCSEQLDIDYTMETLKVPVIDQVNLDELMTLYVNYEYDDNGNIIQYFNFYNYINSPFIEFDPIKKKLKSTDIDGTYLHLGPGETGKLDIVAQFKAYSTEKTLYGVKTVILATYQIWNVSDDKPKFLIRKLYEVGNGAGASNKLNDAKAFIKDKFISLDDETLETDKTINIDVPLNIQGKRPFSAFTFDINFRPNELVYNKINDPSVTVVSDEYANEGVVSFKIDKPFTYKTLNLQFTTHKSKFDIITSDKRTYDVHISNVSALNIDEEVVDVQTSDGSINFGFNVFLRQETIDHDALILTDKHKTSKDYKILLQTAY